MTTVQSPASQLTQQPERGREETLRDGTRIQMRPIHPEDIELQRRFIEALSPASRRFRYLESMNMNAPSAALLKQMTAIAAEARQDNQALIDALTGIEQAHGATPAQVRWPGCWRPSPGWCRFPAPPSCIASKKTSAVPR